MNKIFYFLVAFLLIAAIDLFHWETLPSAPYNMAGTLSAEPFGVLKDNVQASKNGFGLSPEFAIQDGDSGISIAPARFLDPVTLFLLGSGLVGLAGLVRKKV